MTTASSRRLGVRIAVCAAGLVLAACDPGGETKTPAVADAAVEPAPVSTLPRDQWLTVDTAVQAGADGQVVRDEKRRPYGFALLGQPFPEFSAQLVGGGTATQEVFRGKWTVVDVWGIWCGDCRRDGPLVKALAADLDADPTLDFLSIHTPPNRARAAEAYGQFGSVEAYFASEGGGYPTVIDADASLREALHITWTPTYLLVGPDLTIRAFRTDISVGGEDGVAKVIAGVRSLQAAS